MWLTVILTLTTEERPCQKRNATRTHEREYRCSFCGKAQTEVKTLVAGPGVFICDECVQLCQEIIAKKAATQASTQEVPGSLLPDNASTETLLKTLAGYRHGRFREAGLFRRLFEDVVRLCMGAGLVGGEGFAIDASVIEADASRGRKVDGKPTTWPEEEKITRPVREYLAALDHAAPLDDTELPGNPPSRPKATSLTDPAAAWTNKGQVKVGFAYGTNYLIDTQRAIIVDVEPTPARWSAEVAATKTMLERTQDCFGLKPQRLAADAAYGSGLMIGWLMRRGIEPHVPLLDREHQTKGFFTRADFTFDRQANVFICPSQKQLRSSGLVREDGTVPYWASTKDCRACALKPRCTKGAKRIVTRNVFEDEREHVRALKGTEAFERSARERRKVEMLFAHLKRNLGFRRLRLRGITGASDEFLLTATVQNLRKLVRALAYRPPASALGAG